MCACGRVQKKYGKGNETNYFHLITYGGDLLKLPGRYSASGCLEITPDAFQIRPGMNCTWFAW